VIYMDEPERQAGIYNAVGMSEHPFHPQGYGMHVSAAPGRHLGKRIQYEDLPPDCKRMLLQDAAYLDALDDFVRAYLEVALWSSHDDDSNPLDQYDFSKIATSELYAAIEDCYLFRREAGKLLKEWSDEQAGHDFWLTRCGHGAGFWDRGKKHGDALTALVGHGTQFPSRDLYIGDNGLIYGFK